MSQAEDDFYRAVGYFRGLGLPESRAFHHAEQLMEAAMTTFNVTILRRSAMTISFQTDSYYQAVKKAAETITEWCHAYDPIQRVFISELDRTTDLLEYRPEEVVALATTR